MTACSTTDSTSTGAVGIVADAPNFAAWQFLDAQFKRACASEPDFPRYLPQDSDADIQSIGNEMGGIFRRGYQVLVVALGNPELRDDFRMRIHRLLRIWSESDTKPVLLLVCRDKQFAQKTIDEWGGWDQLGRKLHQWTDVIKEAVRVTSEYLGNIFSDLDQCLHTAKSILPLLAYQIRGARRPSSVVAHPGFTRHNAVGLFDPFKPK